MLESPALVHGARNLCIWVTDWTCGLKEEKKHELGHGECWESMVGVGVRGVGVDMSR